jgi:hypothetical protein
VYYTSKGEDGAMTYTEAQITAIGGSPWEKNGKRRIYLNDITDVYRAGYRAEQAERAARIGGTAEAPSNNRLRQVNGTVRSVYLDCADGEIVIQSVSDDYDDTIWNGVRALVGELAAS